MSKQRSLSHIKVITLVTRGSIIQTLTVVMNTKTRRMYCYTMSEEDRRRLREHLDTNDLSRGLPTSRTWEEEVAKWQPVSIVHHLY